MIIVPVSGHNPLYRLSDIHTKAFKVIQACRGLAIRADTRIHDKPIAPAQMRDDTFPETRPKKGDLEFV